MEEDDLPLTALIAKKASMKTITGQTTNEKSDSKKPSSSDSIKKNPEEDDQPVAALIAKKRATNGQAAASSSAVKSEPKKAAAVAVENSDSEDDMPFVEIVKKREREAAVEDDSSKKKKKAKSSENTKSSSSRVPAAPKAQSRPGSSNITADFYDTTSKGQLIQMLMLRWWYAIEWPIMSEVPSPPDGYESLDGYPGVFVSTRVSSISSDVILAKLTAMPVDGYVRTNIRSKKPRDMSKSIKLYQEAYSRIERVMCEGF
jgi:hypothetical protein